MIKGLIAIAVVLGAALLIVPDAARYMKMRDMSGAPPKRRPHLKTPDETRAGIGNPFTLIGSIPSDVARYRKIKSM